MEIKKPMLASKITDFTTLKYPFFASPKLDGVRALTINNSLVSRRFKLIPNDYVRSLARDLPDNFDGELILDNGTRAGDSFIETSRAVMTESGTPNVKYHVFDYVRYTLSRPFTERKADLVDLVEELSEKSRLFVKIVKQSFIYNETMLREYEEKCLENGYEGVMVRGIYSPYKEGRSTEREGYLMKLKRFEDSEAIVLGFKEKMHNSNEAEEDAFGGTKRSHKKEGLIPANTLGKLVVRDVYTNVKFEVGSGFNDEQRLEIWNNTNKYLSTIIKYKYQPNGISSLSEEKPRFPVFLGFRDSDDMSTLPKGGNNYVTIRN